MPMAGSVEKRREYIARPPLRIALPLRHYAVRSTMMSRNGRFEIAASVLESLSLLEWQAKRPPYNLPDCERTL
jgi:hypothetical protein